eukprot:475691-Pyramimonas_sp.AAC.1
MARVQLAGASQGAQPGGAMPQRHRMETPGLTLLFWRDLVPISGCMSDVRRHRAMKYELINRNDATNVAA